MGGVVQPAALGRAAQLRASESMRSATITPGLKWPLGDLTDRAPETACLFSHFVRALACLTKPKPQDVRSANDRRLTPPRRGHQANTQSIWATPRQAATTPRGQSRLRRRGHKVRVRAQPGGVDVPRECRRTPRGSDENPGARRLRPKGQAQLEAARIGKSRASPNSDRSRYNIIHQRQLAPLFDTLSDPHEPSHRLRSPSMRRAERCQLALTRFRGEAASWDLTLPRR